MPSRHTPPTERARRVPLLLLLAAFAVALALAACSDRAGADVREVLVDYNHDEFAGSFLGNFPREVRVHPGMTLRFKQEWTGEPHSVTGGRLVDEVMSQVVPLLERYRGTPLSEIPEDDVMKVEELSDQLPPYMLEDPEEGVRQNVAQPCFRREGGPPEEPATPCPDEEQVQPAFDGSFDFFNSGFIAYEGQQGNVYELPIAEDTAPGTYYFYCNVHGFFQYSKVVVVPPDEEVPSQADVARQARQEIEAWAQPLREAYVQATEEDTVSLEDPFTGEQATFDKPLAGFATDDLWVHGFGSEFVPETMTVEVGEPVTWSFVGGHTVSFEVPAYFSQIDVSDDGTVVFNPEAYLPVNSPPLPEEEPEGEGEAPHEGEGEGAPEGPPPPPPAIDAGEWDGREFISSGLLWEGTYSLTFTQPGTYNYACLVHPRMVGTVTVEA